MVQSRAGSPGTVGLVVRMPEGLRDRIKEAAESNGRSQNSEIVAALSEAYPEPVDKDVFAELLAEVIAGPEKDRPSAIDALNKFLDEAGLNLSANFEEGKVAMHIKDLSFRDAILARKAKKDP
ncbi:Arc family DNA-binding protein [Salipiger manganoxidans]|uniref:Arc family DNA-binding protein n=1 Tax=Salipiger marinus TaxID=555512 RepID=UPI001E4C5AAB|nr:Arc family DNA-binding protein [Salipiger manganoxidans]MCD1619125.1 Arc family DNA-binding protein [Salipiger manganoxidans]